MYLRPKLSGSAGRNTVATNPMDSITNKTFIGAHIQKTNTRQNSRKISINITRIPGINSELSY